MSQHMERCPSCGPTEVLTPRTNGMGGAFLECVRCNYVEPVTRRSDPRPERKMRRLCADGVVRTRNVFLRPNRNQINGQRGGRASAAKKRAKRFWGGVA